MNSQQESTQYMALNEIVCNFLIIGKTGTGKSSLINYLTNNTIQAETGTGKPVTGIGIHKYSATVDGKNVNIYDSWGIEAGKTKEWKDYLKKRLEDDFGVDKPPRDWFHAVIYCIQGSGHRIEKDETDIINKFFEEGYHIVIALTKADDISQSEASELHEKIVKVCKIPSSMVIRTCSVKKIKRDGSLPSKQFGVDNIKKAIWEGWEKTVVNRLPSHCIHCGHKEVRAFSENLKKEINSMSISWLDSENNLKNWLKAKVDTFSEELNSQKIPDIIRTKISECHRIILEFPISPNSSGFSWENNEFKKRHYYLLEFDWSLLWTPVLVTLFRKWNIRKSLTEMIDESANEMCHLLEERKNVIKTEIEEMMSLLYREALN